MTIASEVVTLHQAREAYETKVLIVRSLQVQLAEHQHLIPVITEALDDATDEMDSLRIKYHEALAKHHAAQR